MPTRRSERKNYIARRLILCRANMSMRRPTSRSKFKNDCDFLRRGSHGDEWSTEATDRFDRGER